jgi:NAD(P)-dependent dehydrogenase (short-subunit alcohol dehydrogenase family)
LHYTGEIGNGRATAILLARQGAKVALVDHKVEWAQETKRMIDEEGGISEVIQADVTNEASCESAVARTVELFGTVHILVNIGEIAVLSSAPNSDLVNKPDN